MRTKSLCLFSKPWSTGRQQDSVTRGFVPFAGMEQAVLVPWALFAGLFPLLAAWLGRSCCPWCSSPALLPGDRLRGGVIVSGHPRNLLWGHPGEAFAQSPGRGCSLILSSGLSVPQVIYPLRQGSWILVGRKESAKRRPGPFGDGK